MTEPLLQTTVVGSYPQPDWLVNREMLSKVVPRTRLKEIWRVSDDYLQQAQDDATLLAIRDMERAGIDIITDGEMRRESYSNHFATALEGIAQENPAHVLSRSGQKTPVPRVVGKIRRTRPVEVRDMQFLRANTDRPAKITLPGPFTMGQQVKDEFYKDAEAMCMDYAAAVNEEAHDLVKAGADVIQLDEPWLRNNPEEASRYAVRVINRALQGISVPTVVHLCFGYAAVVPGLSKPAGDSFLPQLADTIAQQISIESAQPRIDLGVLKELAPKKVMLGVIDLNDPEIETPEKIAERIRAGLKYLSPDARRSVDRHPRQAAAGPRLRHEVPAARDGFREAEVAGSRRLNRAAGTQLTRDHAAVGFGRHRLLGVAARGLGRPLTVGAAAQVVDVPVAQRLETDLRVGGTRSVCRVCLGLRGHRSGTDQHEGGEDEACHDASLPFSTVPA